MSIMILIFYFHYRSWNKQEDKHAGCKRTRRWIDSRSSWVIITPATPPDCICLMYKGTTNPVSTSSDMSECISGFIHKPAGITLSLCFSQNGFSGLTQVLWHISSASWLCSKSLLQSPLAPWQEGGERRDIIICLFLTSLAAHDAKNLRRRRRKS